MRSVALMLLLAVPVLVAAEDDTCSAPASWGEVRALESQEITVKITRPPYETHVWRPGPVVLPERRPVTVPVLVFEGPDGTIRLVGAMKSKGGECPVLAVVSRTSE